MSLTSPALDALLSMEGRPAREALDEDHVLRRQREETEPREHVFLSQTVPPSDPMVRAIERRRSGSGG